MTFSFSPTFANQQCHFSQCLNADFILIIDFTNTFDMYFSQVIRQHAINIKSKWSHKLAGSSLVRKPQNAFLGGDS